MLMSRFARRAALPALLAILVGLVGSTGAQATTRPNVGQRFVWRGNVRIFMGAEGPPTTQDCEQQLHIACYAPFQLQNAYDLNALYSGGWDGTGSTIAIVDSFGSPTAEADLARFDADFNLPAPPSFKIIQPAGKVPPFDPSNSDMVNWAVETSLDVQWSHAIAPGANILLVETPVSETEGVHGLPQMMTAENYVINHGMADVISQSFAATEETFPNNASIRGLRGAYWNAKAHNVTVVGATGDAGATQFKRNITDYYRHRVTAWPSTDPLVTAIGGTQLHLDADGNRTAPDNVWNDSYNSNVNGGTPSPIAGGGGVSHVFPRPKFQDGVSGETGDARGVPDISMSAAVDGGVLTYLGFLGGGSGYYIVGGTSEATPEFAGVVAIADQAAGHDLGFLNPLLYKLGTGAANGIVDIKKGNNTVTFTQGGQTTTVKGFKATKGYDLASGLGTPDAAKLVMALAGMSPTS
jgi:subtilase family serine protease